MACVDRHQCCGEENRGGVKVRVKVRVEVRVGVRGRIITCSHVFVCLCVCDVMQRHTNT